MKSNGLHRSWLLASLLVTSLSCNSAPYRQSPALLANSTPTEREDGRWAAQHDRLRYQPDVLKQLMAEYPYQLKFVVSDPSDLAEIETVLKETGADRSRVVLMPEGTSSETLSERARWLVEICKREGFRYGPRLHIDIYGNQRGV